MIALASAASVRTSESGICQRATRPLRKPSATPGPAPQWLRVARQGGTQCTV